MVIDWQTNSRSSINLTENGEFVDFSAAVVAIVQNIYVKDHN
jgi:hypothetical protein